MSVPDDTTCKLKLCKEIQDAYPDLIIDIKGMPAAEKKDAEQWISIDLLNSLEQASQSIAGSDKTLLFQLTCFSKHSEYREDRKFTGPWDLANLMKPYMHRAKYIIETSCLKFLDTKMIYLDLRSSGDFAKESYQNSPILQTHCVLITSRAIIS
jgi:hypothetical protein